MTEPRQGIQSTATEQDLAAALAAIGRGLEAISLKLSEPQRRRSWISAETGIPLGSACIMIAALGAFYDGMTDRHHSVELKLTEQAAKFAAQAEAFQEQKASNAKLSEAVATFDRRLVFLEGRHEGASGGSGK